MDQRLRVKNFRNKWWIGAAVATVLVTSASLCLPEILYHRALRKYRFGATAEALESETGVRIQLRKNGNYLDSEATDFEMRRHFSYDASVPRDYLQLQFNDFHELIATTKRTPLARWGFPETRLHNLFEKPKVLLSAQDIQQASSNETHIIIQGLSERDLPALAKFSDLYQVDFTHGATDKQLQAFSRIGWSNVAQVLLIGCYQVTDEGIDCLSKISSIRGLHLLGTSITDAGCQIIATKMKLSHIELIDCPKVTWNGLVMLARSEALKVFRFSLNNLTQEALVQILDSAQNVKRIEIDIADSANVQLDRSVLRKVAEYKHITLWQKRGDALSSF